MTPSIEYDVPDEYQPDDEWLVDHPLPMGLLRTMSEYGDVTTPFIVERTAKVMQVHVDRQMYARYLTALHALYRDGYVDFELHSPGLWVWCITKAGVKAAQKGDRIHDRLGRVLPAEFVTQAQQRRYQTQFGQRAV